MAKDFSRIITSIPQDRTAASVMRPGYHYEPIGRADTGELTWFAECPEILPLPAFQKGCDPILNLAGRTMGYLTVIGYGGNGGKGSTGKGARWVCRCLCGRYCYCRSQGLRRRKPHQPQLMCDVCNNADAIRNGMPSKLKSVPGRTLVR